MPVLQRGRRLWLFCTVVALTLGFVGDNLVFGQRPKPMQPAPRVNPQRVIVNPMPPVNRQRPGIIYYVCSRCDTELARGGAPPALAQCPRCGAKFAVFPILAQNHPGRTARPEGSYSSTFVRTVKIEGAILGGMIVAGTIGLAVGRMRGTNGPSADAEPSASP